MTFAVFDVDSGVRGSGHLVGHLVGDLDKGQRACSEGFRSLDGWGRYFGRT
jgi:hypothetical protein